jgi:hypothetical protein
VLKSSSAKSSTLLYKDQIEPDRAKPDSLLCHLGPFHILLVSGNLPLQYIGTKATVLIFFKDRCFSFKGALVLLVLLVQLYNQDL